MRVAMFSTMISGGAGYAALRVHEALRLCGAESTLYVGRGECEQRPGVVRLDDAGPGLQPVPVPGLTIFSVDPPGVPNTTLNRIIAGADVFNLHWYARFLSLRNIEQLSLSGKPVVVTIRDMNPLTGGCHYFHGCQNWALGCINCPQFGFKELPLPNATLAVKRALWKLSNIAVVVLSDHTLRIIEQSPLFGLCRLEKIPNPIDTSIFKLVDRDKARHEFGVPTNKRAIAYLPSFSSAIKGATHAVDALRCLAAILPADRCIILCAGDLEQPLDVPFPIINIGFIREKSRLARFYASADVTMIPSLEETFSNTAAESVACGTPIVGFNVGAIPEIGQGVRGSTVPLYDAPSLARALANQLTRERANPAELHAYAAATFSAERIGRQYISLFDELRLSTVSAAAPTRLKPEDQVSAIQRFNDLLSVYNLKRQTELEAGRRIRARVNRLLQGIRLLFTDNRAFRRHARNLLKETWTRSS